MTRFSLVTLGMSYAVRNSWLGTAVFVLTMEE